MTTLPEDREPLMRFLTVQTRLDAELARVLDVAARDTERRILRARGAVEGSRLTVMLRDLREIQHELWVRGIGERVAGRLRDAREAASRAARVLDEFLARVAGERRAEILVDAFRSRVQQGIAVDAARIPQELSVRVYRNEALASGKIERIIRASIIRGMSAREIAQQVESLIDPRVRGGVSHAALRLGRTELNNAFHTRQIAEAQREWVSAVRWNLSRSHPREDVCDVYASRDDGLGSGVWDKHGVPSKPHPQCLCYLTYEMMSADQAVELIASQLAS